MHGKHSVKQPLSDVEAPTALHTQPTGGANRPKYLNTAVLKRASFRAKFTAMMSNNVQYNHIVALKASSIVEPE